MKLFQLALSTSLMLAPVVLLAQAPKNATPVTSKIIQERKTDQQERIAQGVKNGQLTARETSKLEHQEVGINKEEAGMKAQDNGHLTKADKALLSRQQNQESKRIYADKHNAYKR